MVNLQERLDRTFKALTDPTRRAILAQLEGRDGASISELADPFAIRLPGVKKHVDVLANAGLVTREYSRGVICQSGRSWNICLDSGFRGLPAFERCLPRFNFAHHPAAGLVEALRRTAS
jgi:predicted transcriptional regulator